jgi:hypothetical protein
MYGWMSIEPFYTVPASLYRLRNIEPDALPLIALAAQQRLRGLLDAMVVARDHRLSANVSHPPPFDPNADHPTPAWDQVVYSDTEKIMRAIQRVEREEEMKERRERNLRDTIEREAQAQQEAAANGAAGSPSATGEGDGRKEKKRRKDSTKSLSEDQLKKMSDRTARGVLGGKQYSWMTTGGAAGSPLRPASTLSAGSNGLPKPKFTPQQPSAPSGGGGTSTAIPRVESLPSFQETSQEKESNRITLRDAMFALEKERGFGAGAGTGQTAVYVSMARRRSGV